MFVDFSWSKYDFLFLNIAINLKMCCIRNVDVMRGILNNPVSLMKIGIENISKILEYKRKKPLKFNMYRILTNIHYIYMTIRCIQKYCLLLLSCKKVTLVVIDLYFTSSWWVPSFFEVEIEIIIINTFYLLIFGMDFHLPISDN